MDEYDELSIYKIRQTPEVKEIEVFKKFQGKQSSNQEKQKRKKKRDSFKEEFLKRFNLDEERFSINLIKREGKWMIEICHKRSGRCVYQDYETVCSILNRACRLPDNLVGYNINLKA